MRILVTRLSAIGDIVFASPLVDALRARYPDARISWLVQPESQELLCHHPALDEVLVWPRREWQALWRQRRYRRGNVCARDAMGRVSSSGPQRRGSGEWHSKQSVRTPVYV